VPIWADTTELIDDVLGGMFCAFKPPREAVGLAPIIRSTGAVHCSAPSARISKHAFWVGCSDGVAAAAM
jgi:hypothetical protein